MKCPTCGENTPDAWLRLKRESPGEVASHIDARNPRNLANAYFVDWMHCANKECKEALIRVTLAFRQDTETQATVDPEEKWLVTPQFANARPVDPLVVQAEPIFARDYQEASRVLDLSPKASAVLSRRVLADLLEQYAGRAEFGLEDRIEKFNEDTNRPYELRKNLHYLREIANLSAHTGKDDQANIIDVTRDEADWTLQVVDRLFDYFIVTPKKDEAMRLAIGAKVAEANRKPIKALPEDRSP